MREEMGDSGDGWDSSSDSSGMFFFFIFILILQISRHISASIFLVAVDFRIVREQSNDDNVISREVALERRPLTKLRSVVSGRVEVQMKRKSDEDEDDERVDSDSEPDAPRLTRGPGPGQNLGRLSAQGSPYGPVFDLGHDGQSKPQRNLPRLPSPDRRYEAYSPSSPQPQGIPIRPRKSAFSEMAMGY